MKCYVFSIACCFQLPVGPLKKKWKSRQEGGSSSLEIRREGGYSGLGNPVRRGDRKCSPSVGGVCIFSGITHAVLFTFSSASGAAKVNSCRPHMPSSSDADCVDHEVADSISSDALQELVMNVFELGRRQHKFLCETEIPNKVPRAKEEPLKV